MTEDLLNVSWNENFRECNDKYRLMITEHLLCLVILKRLLWEFDLVYPMLFQPSISFFVIATFSLLLTWLCVSFIIEGFLNSLLVFTIAWHFVNELFSHYHEISFFPIMFNNIHKTIRAQIFTTLLTINYIKIHSNLSWFYTQMFHWLYFE